MAHFAEINNENLVIRVLVTDNSMPKEGLTWLKKTYGGKWIKTSYNTQAGEHALGGTPLRKNYAGAGYTYDLERDAFISPSPYSSWLLDEETCSWVAPVNKPDEENSYKWNEEIIDWELIPIE